MRALIVDPGDAAPVLAALERHGLALEAILVTHHHHDHTDGLPVLLEHFAVPVYGPAKEQLPVPFTPVGAGDNVLALDLNFNVMNVPGHTAGHIAFYASDAQLPAPLLFCGDTLFSAGCGRLFEGTPAQMLGSLDQIAALPPQTLVCCAHEYTLGNLQFAHVVEPDNNAVVQHLAHCQQLRSQGLPTLPTTLDLELSINPFLRSRLPTVKEAVAKQAGGLAPASDEAVFARLRDWKNHF